MRGSPTPFGVIEAGIAAIVGALQGISVASGYATDVRYVTRYPVALNSLGSDQVPAISVSSPPGGGGGGPKIIDGQVYEERYRLLILGLVRTEEGTNPEAAGLATKAEALLSDIKSCLMLDPTFGVRPDIDESWLTPPRIQDAGWQRDSALVGVGLEVVTRYTLVRP